MSESLRRDWLAAHAKDNALSPPKPQIDPARSLQDPEGLFKKKKAPMQDKTALSSPPADFLEDNPPEPVVKPARHVPYGEGDDMFNSDVKMNVAGGGVKDPNPPSRSNSESIIKPGEAVFHVKGLQKKHDKLKNEAGVQEEKMKEDPEHETILKFDAVSCLGPRGTFDVEFKHTYLMISRDNRREYYAMPYENITSMIQLERIEHEASAPGNGHSHEASPATRVIIMHLRESIHLQKGGSLKILVVQFVNPPPVRLLFTEKVLDEHKDALMQQMGGFLHKNLDVNGWIVLGPASDIFPLVITVFTGVPAVLPNNYAKIAYQQGNHGSMDGALRCAYKEKYDGWLYLLDDSFLFLENPLIIIKFSTLTKGKSSIVFNVQELPSKENKKTKKLQPFDFGITVEDARHTFSQHLFTGIDPGDFGPMRKFLSDNNLTYSISTHLNPCCFLLPKTKKVMPSSDEGGL